MNKKDNLLLEGLVNGNKSQIQIIYTNLFPKVKQFVMRNNGNLEDAEDIFQKSLLQLISRIKLRGIPEIQSLEAYIFTINKNLWRRELNKKERVTNVSINEQYNESGQNADDNHKIKRFMGSSLEEEALELLEQERWDTYQNCFIKLSENCQKILMYFFSKKPYSSFLSEFGYTSETVARQRVFKCKGKLIQAIKSHKNFKKLLEI